MALVGFLAGVRPGVPPQIGHLNELFIAIVAGEWFLARVQSDVRLEMMISREPLAAFSTFKGFFTGVRSFVVL